MKNLRYLAILPFIAMTVGVYFFNGVQPYLLGLPLLLGWLTVWIILSSAIMALIYYTDPDRKENV